VAKDLGDLVMVSETGTPVLFFMLGDTKPWYG